MPRDSMFAEVVRLRTECDRLTRELDDMRVERDRLRALLAQVQWDKAGYCPLCFPGEAPYRHTEDCPLGRALEEAPCP